MGSLELSRNAVGGGTIAHPRATPSARIGYIDGWRAIAVGMVMLGHVGIATGHPTPVEFGRTGVQIFFTISGFIITWQSLREIDRTGAFSQSDFLARRAFRILPPLLLYVVGMLVIHWRDIGALLTPAIRAATFTCNVGPGCPWEFGHTWSLGFEEQFYLLFPFVLMRRVNLWLLPALAFWLLPLFWPLDYLGLMGHLQTSMLFGLGMLYAYRKAQVDAWFARTPLVAYALPLGFLAWWLYKPGPLQQALALLEPAAIFLIVFGIPAKSALIRRLMDNFLMRRIGLYSYSIYLWQQFATEPRAGWTAPHYVAALVVTVLGCWVSWNTFELYFRRKSVEFGSGRDAAAVHAPA